MKRLLLLFAFLACLGGCGGTKPAPNDLDTTPDDNGEEIQGGEYPPEGE